jgi:hypothetical protein
MSTRKKPAKPPKRAPAKKRAVAAKKAEPSSKQKRSENSPKPQLNDEAREYVVMLLAAYDPPSVVAKSVREQFGFDITPQSVEAYDPTKLAGRHLARKWVDLFHETRKTLIESTAEIGIAHKAIRLRMLDRMVRRAEASGNMVLAAQLVEQAAKECGDAYTNKRKLEHDVPGGLQALLSRIGGSSLPVSDG